MATGIWWEEALISILQWTGQPPPPSQSKELVGTRANSAEIGTQRCDTAPSAALGLFSSIPEHFLAILPPHGSHLCTGDYHPEL